ncbi:MAG: DnaJ domain-containing protein [Leptospirales bacterium]
MNVNNYMYTILGLSNGASLEQIKKAYRGLVRKYHPDLRFDNPEERRKCHAIMVRINMAYNEILKVYDDKQDRPVHRPNVEQQQNTDPVQNSGLPGKPKDPAYVYYKQGHTFFHRGFYKFYRKKIKVDIKLQAAVEILANFQKAYVYYKKVVDEYPESPWVHDSKWKMEKIAKLTPIYHSILKRLKVKSEEERVKEEYRNRKEYGYGFLEYEKEFLESWHSWIISKL